MPRPRGWSRWVLVGLAAFGLAKGRAGAQDTGALPLHERIDRLIEVGREGTLAAPAVDAEFLRRARLDLTGMIPEADEARAFLDDPSPYKRPKLVERLLAAPEFARRMEVVFDVMLMERRPDKSASSEPWQEFLRDAFARDVPYDELVRQVLRADGADPAHRGPARFVLDREGNPDALTRDVARLFLGRDLQCAQCHDHPNVDDYKQAHYQGLFAFFNRSYAIQDAQGRILAFAEKADGDVTFASVFKKKVKHATRPRILDGPELAEPTVAKGQEYRAYPADKVRAIPTYSRRDQLPARLTSGDVPEFSRTIANRLWAMMMGRGLVHPPDMDHGGNPPSHPELLALLTREFAAMKFDVKAFLRELALTRTYQRSSEPPPGASAEASAPEALAVAALKPMSPEQMAWALMQATGLLASTRKTVEHERLDVDPKFRALAAIDAKRKAFVDDLVERAIYERLKGNVRPFVSHFGGAPGQTQDGGQATVDQALFVANGQPIQGWLGPSGGNLTGRLAALNDASALAEELYLAVLTRRPTADEKAEVAGFLAGRDKDRAQAVGELAWALVASTEFRFNH
jgi:hypothetical protein